MARGSYARKQPRNERGQFAPKREVIDLVSDESNESDESDEVSSPTIIVERAGSYAWTHKSWRVREEFVRTVATAVGLFASTEISLQRVLLSPLVLATSASGGSEAPSIVNDNNMKDSVSLWDNLEEGEIPTS